MTTLSQVASSHDVWTDLEHDLWTVIAEHITFRDAGAVACTCRSWRSAITSPNADRTLAMTYARCVLGDTQFWENAEARPKLTRRELPTYRLEIRRIELFRRAIGKSRLAACELYEMWQGLDRPALSPQRPATALTRRAQPE